MSAFLIAFGFFLLGTIAGLVIAYMVWEHKQGPIIAGAFKSLLAEQGYVIRNKRIVYLGEDAETEWEKELRKVLDT